jgi:hypothetical protein
MSTIDDDNVLVDFSTFVRKMRIKTTETSQIKETGVVDTDEQRNALFALLTDTRRISAK